MKIALVQMRSGSDLEQSLRRMEKKLSQLADRGAELVVFPEMAYFTAPSNQLSPVLERYEELVALFASWAKRYQVALLPGSLREPSGENRFYNTLWAFGPKGEKLAKYRKIFLFRAQLPDRHYDEGRHTDAGSQPVTFSYNGVVFGVAICYDLRFPELFRALKKRGAEWVFLPSAFAVPTGRAHWEVLVRARAIENQFYMAAPGLVGRSGNGAATYGNSLLVDPWGKVRAKAGGKPTALLFKYDSRHALDCRSKLDAWASRREDIFPIS